MEKTDLSSKNNKISRKVLFVPSNPSHVATQLPVAQELLSRGYRSVFLTRDSLIEEEYRVETLLNCNNIPILQYTSYYEADGNRYFPRIMSYFKFKNIFSQWLSRVEADAVVVCNDDAALFDRMVVELFRRAGKHTFLVQESVRPAIRKIPFTLKLRGQGRREMLHKLLQYYASRLRLNSFFRKGYAHSSGTWIFAAGDIFRERSLKEGIEGSRIRVTGQPRLDGRSLPLSTMKRGKNISKDKVLLFCNQPVKCSLETQARLFIDLVDATDEMEGVKLIVKLHPRDPPDTYWMQLLRPGQGRSLLDVTRSRTLTSCFEMADAFMTIASTTCIEAMDYGLPVGLIDYLPIEWYLPYRDLDAVVSVQSRVELSNSIKMLLFDEAVRTSLQEKADDVLCKELYLRDGKSAWRIANYIESALTYNYMS